MGTLLRSLSDPSTGSGPRDNAIRTMLTTGARCNEVCQATWREFDLDQGVWTLPGQRRKTVRPGRLMPDHVMPLPHLANPMLRRMEPRDPDALVFASPRGGVLGDWPRWTKAVQRKLGIRVRPHDLRRTFSTTLGELGVPPFIVFAALGHTVGVAVDGGYNKAAYSSEVRDAVGQLADRLSRAQNGWERGRAAEARMSADDKGAGATWRCLGRCPAGTPHSFAGFSFTRCRTAAASPKSSACPNT